MADILAHALGGVMNHMTLKPPQGGGPASVTWGLKSSSGLGMSKPISQGLLNRLRVRSHQSCSWSRDN